MELSRRISPINLLLISINGMVGSAWLFAPLYAAQLAGSGALVAWIIGGVATLLIAFTFAELSSMFPVAGGTAQLPQLSHGSLTSFMVSWAAWLSSLTMAPIEVMAVLQYAASYLILHPEYHAPTIVHKVNGVPVLTSIGLVCAVALMLLMSIINVASFKGLMRFNWIIFSFKILVIVLTITFLIDTQFSPQNFSDFSFHLTSNWHGILAAVASGGIAFAFTGFKHAVELAGEAKNVRVGIPLAIGGSVLICLLLYLGLEVAFIGALHPQDLAQGWQKLSFTGDFGPFAGIALTLGIFWLLKLLYIDAGVSPLGAGLIYMTSTARILYAMSENNFVPKFLMRLNNQHLPIAAIFINFVIGLFLFLPFPGWQAMVDFLVSAMVISYAMGPISLLSFRIELAQETRSFHLPFAKYWCPIAFYCCNLISYWTGWKTIWKLDIALLIGALFFFIAYARKKLNHQELGLRSITWISAYFVGMSLISYLGNFGGIAVITFGWDFLVIAIFSAVILYLAVKERLSYATLELNAPSSLFKKTNQSSLCTTLHNK